jgi:phosphoadenosine phosphosulfate reductase
MLLRVPGHTDSDLRIWAEREQQDASYARTSRHRRRVCEALDALQAFRPGYASISWGKDSVVLAHLCWRARERHGLEIPLASVVVHPFSNPHNVMVRDAFQRVYRMAYHEEIADCTATQDPLLLKREYADAFRRIGRALGTDRYASGLRGDESADRQRRVAAGSTARSCTPIGRWTAADVFAYLHANGLPVHPAYAMSMDGALDREQIRVASIGGARGRGFGRRDWEERYYPDVLRSRERLCK